MSEFICQKSDRTYRFVENVLIEIRVHDGKSKFLPFSFFAGIGPAIHPISVRLHVLARTATVVVHG